MEWNGFTSSEELWAQKIWFRHFEGRPNELIFSVIVGYVTLVIWHEFQSVWFFVWPLVASTMGISILLCPHITSSLPPKVQLSYQASHQSFLCFLIKNKWNKSMRSLQVKVVYVSYNAIVIMPAQLSSCQCATLLSNPIFSWWELAITKYNTACLQYELKHCNLPGHSPLTSL